MRSDAGRHSMRPLTERIRHPLLPSPGTLTQDRPMARAPYLDPYYSGFDHVASLHRSAHEIDCCVARSRRVLEESARLLRSTQLVKESDLLQRVASGAFYAGCVEKIPNNSRGIRAIGDAELSSLLEMA
jgi:hypothetical protein